MFHATSRKGVKIKIGLEPKYCKNIKIKNYS